MLNAPASATKRSRSCNTPCRTPLRPSNYSNVAPGTIDRTDKKLTNDKAHQILEILLKDEKNFPKELIPGGLKSMTAKQFSQIIAYFMKFVIGNSRGRRLSLNKLSLEDIMAFLQQLEYPNGINKSWLKTPNAPHAYPHVVELLHWLCQFIEVDNNISEYFEDTSNLIDSVNEFPSIECLQQFVKSTKKNFQLWSNDTNKEQQQIDELIDKFIHHSTGINGLNQINVCINNVKKQNDDLTKVGCAVPENKEIKEMEKKADALKTSIAKLEISIEQKSHHNVKLSMDVQDFEKSIVKRQNQVASVKLKIQNQIMSVTQRDKLVEDLNTLKELVESKQETLQKIKDIGEKHQIVYSRLVQQQFTVLTRFKKFIYEFFEEVGDITAHGLCVESFELNANDLGIITQKDIANILQNLENLKLFDTQKSKELEVNILNVTKKLQTLQKHRDEIDEQLKHTKETVAQFVVKINSTNKSIVQKKEEHHDELMDAQKSVMELKEILEKKSSRLTELQELCENKELENREDLDRYEEHAYFLMNFAVSQYKEV